jgi:diacylglycerol kinase (ATP)
MREHEEKITFLFGPFEVKDMVKEIRKLKQSFACAFKGIRLCLRYERNFRVHVCIALYVLGFAAAGNAGASQYALFFICFALVIGAELFNTAIENIGDLLADKYDAAVGAAKDIAAGAVLACSFFAALAGAVIFLSDPVRSNLISFFTEKPEALLVPVIFAPFAYLFAKEKRRK